MRSVDKKNKTMIQLQFMTGEYFSKLVNSIMLYIKGNI